jgi:SAM-dependent methyltransferase
MSDSRAHRDAILDQFTRQAVPFATAPSIRDEAALRTVVEFSGCDPNDTVLDVACGPGILACAFAKVARHVTGIDLTPAMLERARALQAEQGLKNVTWKQGDVLPLPFSDASFTLVVSRFAFHHLLEPGSVLTEMRRVCAPGGTVMVIDSVPAPEKAAAFNRVEVLRDPSHVRALPLAEHLALFAAAGLPAPDVLSAANRHRGAALAVVPESRRRRPDSRNLRGLGRRRRARHGDPARRGDGPPRVPRRRTRRATLTPRRGSAIE